MFVVPLSSRHPANQPAVLLLTLLSTSSQPHHRFLRSLIAHALPSCALCLALCLVARGAACCVLCAVCRVRVVPSMRCTLRALHATRTCGDILAEQQQSRTEQAEQQKDRSRAFNTRHLTSNASESYNTEANLTRPDPIRPNRNGPRQADRERDREAQKQTDTETARHILRQSGEQAGR